MLKKHGVIGKSTRNAGELAWWRDGQEQNTIGYEIDTSSVTASMRVQYQNKQTGVEYDYKIYLTSTVPHYGGKRWWFICPVQECSKRVGVLYMGRTFACRHCYNFAYSTQNKTPPFRYLYKAQKIHRDLGGNGCSPGDNIPPKPKDMKWKTYQRRVKEMKAAYLKATSEIYAFARTPSDKQYLEEII